MNDLYQIYLAAHTAWAAAQDTPHEMCDEGMDNRLMLGEERRIAFWAWINEASPLPIVTPDTELDEDEEEQPAAKVNAGEELEKLMFGAPLASHRMTSYTTLKPDGMGW